MENTILKRQFFRQLDGQELLSQVMDQLPELSFFVKDKHGRFMALNRRGCEYCGVAQESEAIGKTDHDFFPAARADEYLADDQEVLQTGDSIINRMESAPETAGSPRLVLTTKIALRDKRGRVIGVAGFSRAVEQTRTPNDTVAGMSAVIKHLHSRSHLSLTNADLAKVAGLSISQFERKFREVFGTSVRKYLTRIRIENACDKLAHSNMSTTQVALECGFYDHAHFSRAFKKQMHCSPVEYRERDQRSNR